MELSAVANLLLINSEATRLVSCIVALMLCRKQFEADCELTSPVKMILLFLLFQRRLF